MKPMIRWDRLGDQAILAAFTETDDASSFAKRVASIQPAGLVDIVQAYRTVAIYYDMRHTSHEAFLASLKPLASTPASNITPGLIHSIPCCYEMGEDLAEVAGKLGLSTDEVIRLHTSTIYTVYAIGFVPGFPYLGYLPDKITGIPRRQTPRVRVEPGSVGITGRQTGIYPLARPGGWALLGRTPLTIVDVEAGFFPVQTGERVAFTRIDGQTFHQMKGERLNTPTPSRI